MKKSFIPFMLLLLVIASCNNNPNEVDTKTYTLCDSVYLENDYDEGYSYYTTNVDLPVTKKQKLKEINPVQLVQVFTMMQIPH